MSFKRKVRRALEKDARIAAGGHANPVKQLMKIQRAIQLSVSKARLAVTALLKVSGHKVPEPKKLDRYYTKIYQKGTSISEKGCMPYSFEDALGRVHDKIKDEVRVKFGSIAHYRKLAREGAFENVLESLKEGAT